MRDSSMIPNRASTVTGIQSQAGRRIPRSPSHRASNSRDSPK
jgi:hypothetical protein